MFTDIVGFSALASTNEEEALKLLDINRVHQKQIIEKHGVYLKEMGDGVLAKFTSAYDSIRCAMEIQDHAPQELKQRIRIGIHLGDVSEKEGDVFGDGVNIASRLESKAKPGSIYFSDSVYQAIKGRDEIQSVYIGTFRLKNIKDPVRTYAIASEVHISNRWRSRLKYWLTFSLVVIITGTVVIEAVDYLVTSNNLEPGLVDVAIIFLVFIVTGILIFQWLRGNVLRLVMGQVVNLFMAISMLIYFMLNPLTVRPDRLRLINLEYGEKKEESLLKSLVFLPISDYTGEQDHPIVLGLHNDLITRSGRLQGMRVISQTSALAYEGVKKPLKEIADDLDVDMVVESSLSKKDTSTILSVKLVNPIPEEKTLWSSDYIFSFNNLSELFDDITRNIYLNSHSQQPLEQVTQNPKKLNSEAWKYAQLGNFFINQINQAGFDKALEYFQLSYEQDSTYSPAISGLALTWMSMKQQGFAAPLEANPIIREYNELAKQVDDSYAEVWYSEAVMAVWTDYDLKRGESAFLKSIELNPNDPISRAFYAFLLMIDNRWEEAWEQMNYGLEIDPLNPLVIAFSGVLNTFEGKLLSASKKFETVIDMSPDHRIGNLYLLHKHARTFQYKKAMVELKKFYLVHKYSGLETSMDKVFEQDGFGGALQLLANFLTKESKSSFVPASRMEVLYGLLGDNEQRMYWIRQMYEQRDPNFPNMAIKTDDPIQEDPRYIALMEKVGFW